MVGFCLLIVIVYSRSQAFHCGRKNTNFGYFRQEPNYYINIELTTSALAINIISRCAGYLLIILIDHTVSTVYSIQYTCTGMYGMVIHIARVWINRVRLPILLVVS